MFPNPGRNYAFARLAVYLAILRSVEPSPHAAHEPFFLVTAFTVPLQGPGSQLAPGSRLARLRVRRGPDPPTWYKVQLGLPPHVDANYVKRWHTRARKPEQLMTRL